MIWLLHKADGMCTKNYILTSNKFYCLKDDSVCVYAVLHASGFAYIHIKLQSIVEVDYINLYFVDHNINESYSSPTTHMAFDIYLAP